MVHKQYDLEASPLYKLRSKKRLAELLSTNLSELKILAINIEMNYKIKYEPKLNSSEKRIIEAPSKSLKLIQKQILRYFSRLKTPDWVKAGKRGESYVTNARHHSSGKYFLCCDIEKFYPSISRNKVFQLFKYRFKMEDDIAWLITDLVTYQEHIPTGSPCSQALAYWANENMFEKIYDLSSKQEIKMSVYVDDLTFSSGKKVPVRFHGQVMRELTYNNLKLKKNKTRFFAPCQYKEVTGCCITPENKVVATNKIKAKLRNKLKVPLVEQSEADLKSIAGLVISIQQLEPKVLNGLKVNNC